MNGICWLRASACSVPSSEVLSGRRGSCFSPSLNVIECMVVHKPHLVTVQENVPDKIRVTVSAMKVSGLLQNIRLISPETSIFNFGASRKSSSEASGLGLSFSRC